MSAKSYLYTFIAGAACGTVLGLFYAPVRGSETRRRVSTAAGKIDDAMKEVGVYDAVNNVKETVTSKFKEYSESRNTGPRAGSYDSSANL